jgi:hypothetical protein
MIKALYPIVLIIAAIGLFWVYTNPAYSNAQTVKAQVAQYDNALSKSKELQKLRDSLSARYASFSTDDLNRLHLLLPDTVDNIQLVFNIDTIASRYGMVIRDLKLNAPTAPGGDSFDPSANDIHSVDLSFSVSTDYPTFLKFVKDLQDSLRIIDITAINFNVPDKGPTSYTVTIRTYWLP